MNSDLRELAKNKLKSMLKHTQTQQNKITSSNQLSPIHFHNTHATILIPHDTTLILAKTASKRIQQLGYVIKQHATPHPHGCGVKGELSRLKAKLKMTPCIGRNDAQKTLQVRFSPNAKQTLPYGPNMPRRLENGSA